MFIKQLSVFVENSEGNLQNIVDTLGEKHINIRALSIADTTEFGILRLIVDDAEKAAAALREIGVISKVSDVIAAAIEDCAFAWCGHLTDLYLPDSPCMIAATAFKECVELGDPLRLVSLEAV